MLHKKNRNYTRRNDIQTRQVRPRINKSGLTYFIVRPKLNSEEQEIRILELLPGVKNDPITAKFVVTSLKDPASFEPLSYAWGDASTTKEVEVDGQACLITRNLFSALQNLRK